MSSAPSQKIKIYWAYVEEKGAGSRQQGKEEGQQLHMWTSWEMTLVGRQKNQRRQWKTKNIEDSGRWCPSELEISQVKPSKLYGPFICLVDDKY